MVKKNKDKDSKKSTPLKDNSKRGSISSPQSIRNVNFERTESVTYTAVPLTDTEDPTAESEGSVGAPSPSKSKSSSKRKDKKAKSKKKSKRRAKTDSDDDFIALERKPSPVLAPLPSLTRKEYEFFEMVREGDIEQVAAFLLSDSFKDMDINKFNKSGYTILHIAVKRQDEDMVRLLLEQPGIRLYDTILYAIKEENVDVVKLLLKHYDLAATEEQRQSLMNSALIITQDPGQQETLSKIVTTSLVAAAPVVSPISLRSGVKSSIRLSSSSNTVRSKVITTSVSKSTNPADETEDEIPFDSEFSPVLTPLMLAAQQGSYSLIELFYSRNERLETEEFHHNVGCTCDICAKLEGDLDMTRAYQRYNLYKAITNTDYMCFLGRNEHKDPVNYALKKIMRIREIVNLDYSFSRLFVGIEEKLEEFITKMLELCRSTTETEIFLSPKDDSDERLPHLYPRLWYTTGHELRKFVSSPNAQNIVYQLWATDHWPQWDTFSKIKCMMIGALRVVQWPFIGLYLVIFGKNADTCQSLGHLLSPVSRFLTYIGSYICFMVLVGIQSLYPYQRCNNGTIPWPHRKDLIDDSNCTQRGPPFMWTEPILVIYILSFYVSMLKRQSVSWYWRMKWNWIDLIDQLLFTAMFAAWGASYLWTLQDENKPILQGTERTMWPPDCAEIVADCLLALSFLFAFARLMRFLIVIPSCGPIQIGIGYQVIDFLKGLLIMLVVIVAFGSGLMGIFMPYEGLKGVDPDDSTRKLKTQDDSFHSITNTFKTLFWIMQGKKGKDSVQLLHWRIVRNGTEELVHHVLNAYTGKFLFLAYHIIGALMLKNMLAGYFSQTMTQIDENLDMYWKYAKTEMYLTIVKDTAVPPPLNIIPPLPEWKRSFKWISHLGRKNDPKASCSMRQCCFITSSKKTRKWDELMMGYRKLILQLIYRYMNSRTEEQEQETASKDDVLEIAEALEEMMTMLKKASENIVSSDEDDDDDHQFPGGASGTKTGWTKTKSMLQSRGATFLKNKVESGGPSGAPSGNTGGSGGNPGGANSQMETNPDLSRQQSKSKGKSGGSPGGKGTPTKTPSQQTINTAMNTPPKATPSGDKGTPTKTPSQQTINTAMNTPPKRDPSGGKGTPTKTPGNANDDLKSEKIVEKFFNDVGSMRRDSPPKQSTTSNRSKPSYIPNELEKGSRTTGAIERNPGLEDFSGVCGIDSVFKSGAPSSNRLPGNNNPFNSTTKTVNNTISTPPSQNNQISLNNNNFNPTKSYSRSKRGSKSGGGLEKTPGVDLYNAGPIEDTCGFNYTKDVTGNPSKSSKIILGPTLIQSQITPKKTTGIINTLAGTTPSSQVNQHNTKTVPSSRSKPMKPFVDNSTKIKPPTGALSNKNEKTVLNACEYSQPRRGSRSGGGLERSPEIGDFSGLGGFDEPYKSLSKSTIADVESTFKKSPIVQDSTKTTSTSKANNLNSGVITKEQSFKSIKTLKSTIDDTPCGGNPSGKTNVSKNDYGQPRRGSRSGGGLERSPEIGDFSGLGGFDEPYKSISKSTNVDVESTFKKPPLVQDFAKTTSTSKANNFNSGVITKEQSLKSIKTLKSTMNDEFCGGDPSGKTTVSNNDYAQPRRGSRSGGGLERPPEMGDFSGPGEFDDPYKSPSKSAKNLNSGVITKEQSFKSIKTLKSTMNDEFCGGVPSGKTTASNNDYAQPRRGSRSGGGLERPPEMGDFSGAGQFDEPYKPTSKSAKNLNSGVITKDQSFKSSMNDEFCGGVPSGKTIVSNNDYAQPRRGSRSGGGLERPPEMGDFSGAREFEEPYKSTSKSTNNFCSIADMGGTSKKTTAMQNYTNISPKDSNKSERKPCSSCTVKPSSASKTGCNTCSAKLSTGTNSRNVKESLYKGEELFDEMPRRGSGKLVDVWPTTSTVAGSTREIPLNLATSAGPTSAKPKVKLQDSSPLLTEVTFQASKKPQIGDDQNSPSKSPSLVPYPTAKAPTIPPMPPRFTSDSSGDATDGSSKANDYKNPQPKSKPKQGAF